MSGVAVRGLLVVLWGLVVLALPLYAQDDEVTVPDLRGLSVPRAAAALNAAGLRLGQLNAVAWTAAMSGEPGHVDGQNPAPGKLAALGTAITLNVLSDERWVMLYDENDFTLLNASGTNLRLRQLSFQSEGGSQGFAASRWRNRLPAGECAQVWSVSRSGAKTVPGCEAIYWMTTNNTAEHFWTQNAGVERFTVIANGQPAATCDAAPAAADTLTRCEVVVVPRSIEARTAYLYLAYTPTTFVIVNTARDAWMPLDSAQFEIPGLSLMLSDPALLGSESTLGDSTRLAPGQCGLLTTDDPDNAAPPEACSLMTSRQVSTGQAFWNVSFDLLPTTRDGERLSCPPASPDRVTVCIMPR